MDPQHQEPQAGCQVSSVKLGGLALHELTPTQEQWEVRETDRASLGWRACEVPRAERSDALLGEMERVKQERVNVQLDT